jgi:predicted dehydrogenase
MDIVGEFGNYNVYDESIKDFTACVRTGKQPRVDGGRARDDIELVFACYESAGTGCPVTLPLEKTQQ